MVMQRRGNSQLLGSLRRSMDDYHPLTRGLMYLTIGHPLSGRLGEGLLRAAATLFDLTRSWAISRFVYSELAIYHYWRGVLDAYGDVASLRGELFGPRFAAPTATESAR